jgi:hypothetical protein
MDQQIKVHHDQIWKNSDINKYYNYVIRLVNGTNVVSQSLVDQIPTHVLNESVPGSVLEYVTDNVISNVFYNVSPEFYGVYRYDPQYQDRLPIKLFNCFMNRTCPIRQSWLYQFQRRGILDQGFVSFNLDYRDNDLKHISGKPEIFEALFNRGNEIFAQEHEALKYRVPYSSLSDTLEQSIIDSKISIVIETYFEENRAVAYSEKIFRQLQMPRPFVLFCAQHAVKHLRDIGFDVYDDYVDHSYDSESFAIDRQVKMLDIVDSFKNIVYNQAMLDDLENRAKHNRQVLDQLKQAWPEKFKDLEHALRAYK